METGKTGKYLKYAIGEIILVMVGILLALQVNNWNENRKERAQETILLKQLLTDFNSNLNQLDQKISFRKDFMNSSKQLFRYIDNPNLRHKDSIDFHIAKTMPYATFDPIINDLASSGELSLIKNTELKHALSRWSSEINDVIGSIKIMLDNYMDGNIDELHLAENKFINTMSQEPGLIHLLPTEPNQEDELSHHWDYIYEPDSKSVIDNLLVRYIESLVYQGIVENVACEMSARMVAMKSASDNASDLIDELQLIYNKARQASITQELSEIVAGAAAV